VASAERGSGSIKPATLDESCVASCSRESPDRRVKLEARGTRRLKREFVRDTIERRVPTQDWTTAYRVKSREVV